MGTKTVQAAAEYCPLLVTVNLNYTAVTPASLAPLVVACSHLEVLKLAGIPNWVSNFGCVGHRSPLYSLPLILQTDATFTKFLAGVNQDFKLLNLRTLKLRQTALSDASLNLFISLCPNLKRLDLSFTLVRHLSLPKTLNVSLMEKLSLTSTSITSVDLLALVSLLPQLKTLSLGALGGGHGSSVAVGNSTAMTMNEDTLAALTNILKDYQHLEDINLVGNTKLGLTGKSGISGFISNVGRRCKVRENG